jgi:hypothetical protein
VTEGGQPGRPRGIWCRLVPSRQNASHHIPVDGNTESQGDLLRDPRTPPARVPLFHVDDSSDDLLAGPLGARLHRLLRRKQPAILPLDQRSMQAQQRGRLEGNRGTDQPARADETRTQTGDHAIRGTEIGRPSSRTTEDQQLVPDEHGFGHHRAGAAGTGESGHGHQPMEKQDGQIAHRRILPRSRHRQRTLTALKFAMDTIAAAALKPIAGTWRPWRRRANVAAIAPPIGDRPCGGPCKRS